MSQELCFENSGRRVYDYGDRDRNLGKSKARKGRVYVECIGCGAQFSDADNVGNLPRHITGEGF